MANISLSPREKEVMGYIATGMTEDQIAARLGLSRVTISRVTRNIRQKCTSCSITQAMFVVTSTGVIGGNDTK